MPDSASSVRADSAATRLRIVRRAEELFASRSIDGVSLQEVGRAAGQRNRSAVQYHFEDKLGLLAAILDRHSGAVSELRSQMLDEIEEDGEAKDLRRLAEAFVVPVAREAEESEGGMAFVSISAELVGHPSYSRFYFERAPLGSSRRLFELVTAASPRVPREYRWPRMITVTGLLFHGLSDWSNAFPGTTGAKRAREWEALKAHIVASVTGLWAAQPWVSGRR